MDPLACVDITEIIIFSVVIRAVFDVSRGGARVAKSSIIAIGIGSNLGPSAQTVRAAARRLAEDPTLRNVRASSLYNSAPVGPIEQPAFVNAVVCAETACAPAEVLANLLALEQSFGRERRERWGPRILDLDLLLFGETTLASPGLDIPHPRMFQRGFVLVPLAEVAPDLRDPVSGQTTSQLRDAWIATCDCPSDEVWVLKEAGAAQMGACR